MSVLFLNIVGGLLIVAGTAVVMYASYQSDKENQDLTGQLSALKTATKPEAMAVAVADVNKEKLLAALNNNESISHFFPMAIRYEFSEPDYLIFVEYLRHAKPDIIASNGQHLSELLIKKFPNEWFTDARARWIIARYFTPHIVTFGPEFVHKFASSTFSSLMVEYNYHDALILRNIIYQYESWGSVEQRNVIDFIGRKYPNQIALLEKVITDEISDSESLYFGTPLAFHFSELSGGLFSDWLNNVKSTIESKPQD